jgi:hypothetical protein
MKTILVVATFFLPPVMAQQLPEKKPLENTPVNAINPCYGLNEFNSLQKCIDDNKLIPMPTRPVVFGGSGSKKPYLKLVDYSQNGITYVFYQYPLSGSSLGLVVHANCSTKYVYTVDADGKRNLIGTFAKGSTSDFACYKFSGTMPPKEQ